MDLVREGGTSAFRDDPVFQALQCKLQVVHRSIYEPLDLVKEGGTSAFCDDRVCQALHCKAKQKYRRIFETQKSGNQTSSGEIRLDIRTHVSPKVGQDQVSGGVSVLCWHAATVSNVLWKPHTIR